MAGAFAFGPELLARAAKEGYVTARNGFVESLAIHVADHEHTAGSGILNDGRDEAILFVKIEHFAHLK
jgi:hypothetical protein